MSAETTSFPRRAWASSRRSGAAARARWAGLVVVSLGMLMAFLNITQTVAVLEPLQRDLHATSAEFVWVASVYTMVVASLVLSAGTLGDILGRRAVFAAGTALLGAGSLVVFLAAAPAAVIAGQAIMGVGGAMVLPNSLAIVTHAFTDPDERTSAVSVWVAVSGVGLAVGPLAAGLLLESFSWHSVFLVNVVLAVVVLLLTPSFVADSRVAGRRLDPAGLVLAIVAIGALNYAVIEGGHDSFTATSVLAAFVVAALAGLAFVAVEARSRAPMLHLPLFRIPSFSAANVVGFVGQYAFVGIAFAQVLYLEQVRHDSILTMGLQLLPLMVAYVVVSSVAARAVRSVGFKATIAAGLVLDAAALALMLGQGPDTAYGALAVVLILFGAGAGLLLPPATASAVVSVPHQEGGMASGTVNMFRQVGGTLGASITGTILTSSAAFTGALHAAVLIPAAASVLAAGATLAFVRSRAAPA